VKKFLMLDCFLFTLEGDDVVVETAFGTSSVRAFLACDGSGSSSSLQETNSFLVTKNPLSSTNVLQFEKRNASTQR
jgi:hypothetical protein